MKERQQSRRIALLFPRNEKIDLGGSTFKGIFFVLPMKAHCRIVGKESPSVSMDDERSLIVTEASDKHRWKDRKLESSTLESHPFCLLTLFAS